MLKLMNLFKEFIVKYRDVLPNKYRKEFFNEVLIENFTRIKFVTSVFFIWAIVLIAQDFYYFSSYKDKYQFLLFFLDIVILVGVVSILYFSQKLKPISSRNIYSIHRFFILGSALFLIVWGAIVGSVEQFSLGNYEVLIIVYYSIATIIYFRGRVLFTLFSFGFLLFLLSNYFLSGEVAYSFDQLFTQFSFVFSAWVISRVMFFFKVKGYVSGKRLEELNSKLESKILEKNEIEKKLKIANETLMMHYSNRTDELTKKSFELKEKENIASEAKEKLFKSERRYKALFESAKDAILILDGMIIIDCNPAASNLFECDKINIIGKTPIDFSPKFQPNNVSSDIAFSKIKLAILHEHFHFEWKHVTANGKEFDALVTLNKMQIGNTDFIIAFVKDITEDKRLRNEIIKAKEIAENSDRIKSEFLAQISHEIRTPVNSIVSFTSLLKEELKNSLDEDQFEIISHIENGSKRLIRTIELILNMSELQNNTYNPVFKKTNITDEILKPVIAEYKLAAENKGLKINYDNGLNHDLVYDVDTYSLSQIFSNLVDNAIKYTEHGEINIICSKNRKGTYISVKDSGIGISHKYISKLFEPFSQQETGYTRKFEGNGLGLALVKKFSDINNILIEVETEVGKGTDFKLYFYGERNKKLQMNLN